jgi:hypothetical protein
LDSSSIEPPPGWAVDLLLDTQEPVPPQLDRLGKFDPNA